MRLDVQGNSGARRAVAATIDANGSTTSSIIGEWYACEVCSRRCGMPFVSSFAANATIAASAPDTTVRFGALSAATDTPGGSSAVTTSAGARTVSIAPAGAPCIRRPRCATSPSASSRANVPPMQAATYSPMLCPIIASGRTPHDIHSCASAYSTANSAGCVIAVCVSVACAASRSAAAGYNTVRRSMPSSGCSTRAQSSSVSRNAGSDS